MVVLEDSLFSVREAANIACSFSYSQPSSLNDFHQNHHKGDNQQNMDISTHGVRRDKT